jgi:hypothetical protein
MCNVYFFMMISRSFYTANDKRDWDTMFSRILNNLPAENKQANQSDALALRTRQPTDFTYLYNNAFDSVQSSETAEKYC